MNIDDISQRIISSFNAEDEVTFNKEKKNMLFIIHNYEYNFSIISRPYLVAKSLYFMLTDEKLTVEEQMSCVKLAYYCLLSNYLKNCNSTPGCQEYTDYILGCKLALVLLFIQPQYITFSIIVGIAHNIKAKTHVRNQILLFGGIIKETNGNNTTFPLEDVIKNYYEEIYDYIHEDLPHGTNLAKIKNDCASVIKNIVFEIKSNFEAHDFD